MFRLPEALTWIRKIIYLWVRSRSLPDGLRESSGIDPEKPVCYILRSRSWSDLLVLDHHCAREGLPRPQNVMKSLKDNSRAAVLYLSRSGMLQRGRTQKMPSRIRKLIAVAGQENLDVQVVPVSVFWGRNPGKEEKSLFKLLFFDDEHGGWFQRLVTFFVQGRQVYCNFGKPVSLGELIGEGAGLDDTTRKLRRVLLVHFRRQREFVLGPYIYNRRQVISGILKSKNVQDAIRHEAAKRRVPYARIESKARKYADEVCARISHPAIRFFDILLSWLWKKIYDGIEVKNSERLRSLAEDYELVYMPAHRSHMDYLLIGYVLYHSGFLPPHTIAGINLNFWPVGPLLRRGGGVFIRRSFSGNRLYGKVVSEFVSCLTTAGFPFCFYPEGGRSRTGLLLPPRMGILSMVVQAAGRRSQKPILLVPVWVGYDRIMESRSYGRELRGRTKKSESLKGLLKASKLIRSDYGKAYINFGTPLDLQDFMDAQGKGWNETNGFAGEKTSLTPVVSKLAQEMAVRTNQAAVISPVSLYSLILLAAPKKAMNEADLLSVARLLLELLKKVPFHKDVEFPDPEHIGASLKEVEKLTGIRRFKHPGGDVIYVNESDSVSLSYYRNNILHLFMLPSLVSVFLRHRSKLDRGTLIDHCVTMYQFVSSELFLGWNSDSVRPAFEDIVNAMKETDSGLLLESGTELFSPDLMSQEYICFKILTEISGHSIEKYALYGVLLARYSETGRVKQDDFFAECALMTKRMGILNGLSDSVFDRRALQSFVSLLSSLGHIRQTDSELILEGQLETCTDMFLEVLSNDIRDSIVRAPVGLKDLWLPENERESDEAVAAR